MIPFEHLFVAFGMNLSTPGARVAVVRHQDSELDVREVYRSGQLELYQSFQSKPVFRNYDLLVSFVGHPDFEAVFAGVYRVGVESAPGVVAPPPEYLAWPRSRPDLYHYELTKDPRFDSLQDRLVIGWGGGTRAWVQKFRPNSKPVVELLPEGYVRDFPGFLDFTLTFDELKGILKNPAAHRQWHLMLSSVAGVYLILNGANGEQYVGSAYGAKGILGRWAAYADNGHGGNVQLRELGVRDPLAKRQLRFSILQTLPRTLTAGEVIAHERRHKEKLGSRAHGLNSN
jgi:hypothetical protein